MDNPYEGVNEFYERLTEFVEMWMLERVLTLLKIFLVLLWQLEACFLRCHVWNIDDVGLLCRLKLFGVRLD